MNANVRNELQHLLKQFQDMKDSEDVAASAASVFFAKSGDEKDRKTALYHIGRSEILDAVIKKTVGSIALVASRETLS